MATVFKPQYTTNAAITMSVASLANGSYWQSAAVDNTTALFADAHIYGHVKSNGTPTANAVYTLFLYWSNDGGTTYSNNASGLDQSFTQSDNDANMVVGATAVCVATASLTSNFRGFSFCQQAGLLYLPVKWGLILKNSSGQPLTGTGANHVFSYQGVNMTGV